MILLLKKILAHVQTSPVCHMVNQAKYLAVFYNLTHMGWSGFTRVSVLAQSLYVLRLVLKFL